MLELVFLGAIALILITKLFQILGERSGYEDPEMGKKMSEYLTQNPQESEETQPQSEDEWSQKPDVVLSGALERDIQKIKAMDEMFRVDWFLQGAGKAYEALLQAFAQGDRETLSSLLSPPVYRAFDQALTKREKKKHRLETTLIKFDPPTITEAKCTNKMATITVTFTSEQTNILYDARGNMIEGNPKQIEEVVDAWVFERDLKAQDPNWTLVKIRS